MKDRTGPQSASQGEPTPQPSGAPAASPSGRELPVVGSPRPERADARRNRLRVLEAADRLFTAHGVRNVSLDAIAAEAGVGKGTVFRRFGDRAGLAVALLDEREQQLQAQILTGPPPLGPGAPPATRATAFLEAYLDLLDRHTELFLDSENASPGARYRIGSYHLWHRHLAHLTEQANPTLDPNYTAHTLLAPLAADLHTFLRTTHSLPHLKSALTALVTTLLTPPPPSRTSTR
ncbi:TetR/AcrR family transcriptional regulator [Kribbella sandramycini]|uniref:AcrR family transcriptional regulator n=1 Tax=Kribbella sandramycini TaxID=60450 RepID=A0A7Y4L493_9ACTN|nr:TetR/AcrR family transcriptional regulator [Kribbella sandramycini]MBB6571449.1 AcrR family transcriptional regulator [Kribbella sandramycini]NOL44100.1 TetR/AcrR family transcriptional regulator [Kribbella sandramycini]